MDIEVRSIQREDAEGYLAFCRQLDGETANLLLEPGERPKNAILQEAQIGALLSLGEGFYIAEDAGRIVGFLLITRGRWARTRHSASLGMGVLRSHQKRSIGTALLRSADAWAQRWGIRRLELTVRVDNTGAIALYEKMEFLVEGRRLRSLFVDGDYVDELLMAKMM